MKMGGVASMTPMTSFALEIEAALTRNVRVIPILVDGATMPRADELPPSLARLVRRNALELSPARFDYDTGRLLKVLDRTLTEVRIARGGTAQPSPPVAPAGLRGSSAGKQPSIVVVPSPPLPPAGCAAQPRKAGWICGGIRL